MTDEFLELDQLLDELYAGHERLSRAEIQRRAVVAELPAALMSRIDALPEGEYAHDEAIEALHGQLA